MKGCFSLADIPQKAVSSLTVAKRDDRLPDAGSKTVNSQGCFLLRKPIKTRENCCPLIYKYQSCLFGPRGQGDAFGLEL